MNTGLPSPKDHLLLGCTGRWCGCGAIAAIVLGVLNIRPGDRRLNILSSRFTDSAMLVSDPAAKRVRRHPTHHKNGRPVPGKRIDYIYVDRRSVSVQAVGLLAKRHWLASDHIGVSAVLSLK